MSHIEYDAVEAAVSALREKKERLLVEIAAIDKSLRQLRVYGLRSQQSPTETPIMAHPIGTASEALSINEAFPATSNIRIQILFIMDLIGKAAKMSEVQDKYNELSGKDLGIRDFMRGLNKQGLLKVMKINGSNRLSYWVKTDWINGNDLLPQYKFDGFNTLYGDAPLQFT